MLPKLSHLDALRISEETLSKDKSRNDLSTLDSQEFEDQLENTNSQEKLCKKKLTIFWFREYQNFILSHVIDLPESLTVKECFAFIVYEFNRRINALGINGANFNLNLNNYKLYPAKKSGYPKDDYPVVDLKAKIGKFNIEKVCILENENSSNSPFTRADLSKFSTDKSFYNEIPSFKNSISSKTSDPRNSTSSHYSKLSNLSIFKKTAASTRTNDERNQRKKRESPCMAMLVCKF